MAKLIDTGLLIDLTRSRSPKVLKEFIAPFVDDVEACVADPIIFELVRGATDAEVQLLTEYFNNLRRLPSPDGLWKAAADLGRTYRKPFVMPDKV